MKPSFCVKNLFVLILCITAITANARYETVTLGTVSWSGETEWGSGTNPFSDAYIQAKLLEKAQRTYPGYTDYSVSIIQNSKQYESKDAPYQRTGDPYLDGYNSAKILSRYKHNAAGQVTAKKWVEDPRPAPAPQQQAPAPATSSSRRSQTYDFETALTKAVEKALEDVQAGSRIAFNKISAPSTSSFSKSEVKAQILEILIDNNFKVVAKEYFDTIKDELEEQRSEQYNTRTKAKENNLSASGYLLDCKIDASVIRIYIINVSTGEYTSASKESYN